MRHFETSHPWIKFKISLADAPPRLWLALGECQSKIEHLSRVPLQPKTADDFYKIYLAKGIQATTAIEGNTLTEEQVRNHLEGTLRIPDSQEYLMQEVDNVLNACNKVLNDVRRGNSLVMDASSIMAINQLVLHQLEHEDHVVPGALRQVSVGVGRYLAAPPEDCEFLLNKLCEWLASDDFAAPVSMANHKIVYAILKAIVAHVYIAWIHPFGDGNGRTARLVEFQILIESGIPAPACHLLSNHYNLTRTEYYRQLDRASKSGGDLAPFIEYAVNGLRDGLMVQLEYVWEQHYDIVWRDYVYDFFSEKESAANVRRRQLLLDISRNRNPVTKEEIRTLSVRVADAYLGKTPKTVSRDISALLKTGLLTRDGNKYKARKDIVLGLLPIRVQQA